MSRKLLIRYITWSTVINTIPPISEQTQLSAKPPSEPLCSCDITVPRLTQRNSETLFCEDKWGGKRQHLLLLQHYKKQKQITLSLQAGNKKQLNLYKEISKSFPLDQRSTYCDTLCPKTEVTRFFLHSQHGYISVWQCQFSHMIWPPQSPDLNPCENLRDML